MTEDLSGLKVGDKVYSLIHGWGKVKNSKSILRTFPIHVEFDSHSALYTSTGKTAIYQSQNQELFTYNPFEKSEFPKWMEAYTKDVWVIYKSELNTYLGFDNEKCDTGTARWYKEHEIKEISQPTEMTIKEIEEKLGISNLKIVK